VTFPQQRLERFSSFIAQVLVFVPAMRVINAPRERIVIVFRVQIDHGTLIFACFDT
jgi:hypothetical protein